MLIELTSKHACLSREDAVSLTNPQERKKRKKKKKKNRKRKTKCDVDGKYDGGAKKSV